VQLVDGRLIVSATDLVGFLECDHLVTLELDVARGEREKPFRSDPELDLIRKRGFEHEQRYLARLRSDGRTIHEIAEREARTPAELRDAEAETLAAMRAGADVIFQATFFDGRWRGHADFLLRRDDRPSTLGSWSYDVADTKLARRVKAAAILQMCVYADLLERLQGIAPETVSVVTGDGESHPHRLADYGAYYRAAKARFEERVFGDGPRPDTYPEPVEHCRVCTWWPVCIDRRRADDHLSIVAGAARSQRKRLVEDGVPTLTALAELPEDRRVRGLPPRILDRLRRQAALQLGRRRTGKLRYELIPPAPDETGKGLAALPAPSPHDMFFDIEADPWALEDGLEYLLGYVDAAGGSPEYRALWGHDRAGEKAAFETFIDLVMERLERDPTMHVYHYGGYESGAIKRLMQRHATREDEVDRLLRGRVLVNLYDHVVRSGLRASVESYSIKQIEKFYLPAREGPITEAGFSVVQYESWLETGEAAILEDLAAYNRDDCLSNLGLRDWLEGLRTEAAPLFPDGVVPRPTAVDGTPPEQVAKEAAETRRREDALRAGLPADRAVRTADEGASWLLAGLLGWHRREALPQWWMWFTLMKAPMEDLVASGEALGELEFVADLGPIARSRIQRYRFDPAQETKLKVGEAAFDPIASDETHDVQAGTIVAIDPIAGTIDLKRNPANPHPRALVPGKPWMTDTLRDALRRFADHVIENGIDGLGPYRAARELLLRRPPRIIGRPTGGDLIEPGETVVDAARRLVVALDGTTLAVQGPPGTGKTWTGARMVLELVRSGRRVGVTAQSHKVISNFLEAVARAAAEGGEPIRIGQRADDAADLAPVDGLQPFSTTGAAAAALTGGAVDLVGGTAWLWASPDLAGAVDVLFVDEAGQMSLANTVAIAGATDSLVLLGDPNQLPQVSGGSHPEGADASALEHVVAGARTIAPDQGLLLGTTFRLHPDVNGFISEVFYEGLLEPAPENALQDLDDGLPVGGTGIRHVGLDHRGAGNRSREEADWIATAIGGLLGRPWTDRHGRARRLEVEDILVVAPYNAQVAEIAATVERRLGVRPNVGTVDRFQGREAPVAIYSMTSSSPEEAPREMEFLYSGNRLNVAISRAQGLAVLVAAPALLRVACRTPEQMRLANALCRLAEVATAQAGGSVAATTADAAATERYEILDLGLDLPG